VIWVGNDVLLPTQNTKSRVGMIKNRGGGGKVKKEITATVPDAFLPALFRKLAGAEVVHIHMT